MKYHIAHDIDSLAVSGQDWNRLAESNETNTVFQTYQWNISWAKAFSNAGELLLIAVTDGNELIGIAPLFIRVDAGKKRVLTFIGEGSSDYCDFIISSDKPAVLREIFKAIDAQKAAFDRIYLNHIPETSSTVELVRDVCSKLNYKMAREDVPCSALVLKNHEGIHSLLTKYSFRRPCNYFKKHGKVAFLHTNEADVIKSYLPLFFEQHIERCSLAPYESLFRDERNRYLYEEFLKQAADQKWLLFSIFEHNGQPVAMHYGFDYASKIIWYKPSFDINYSQHSPGKALMTNLIEYALQHNKDELDFTVGVEFYKNHLANTWRNNVRMTIYMDYYYYLIHLGKNRVKRLFPRIAETIQLLRRRGLVPR